MKYRRISAVVDAIKLTKDNSIEIAQFLGSNYVARTSSFITVRNDLHGSFLNVFTGDWIIKGSSPGDFYPCKEDEFQKLYEPIEETEVEQTVKEETKPEEVTEKQ